MFPGAKTLLKQASKLIQTASKDDVERIRRLVKDHGDRTDQEVYENIAGVAICNMDTVVNYAQGFLEEINEHKKSRKIVVRQERKAGVIRRMIRWLI